MRWERFFRNCAFAVILFLLVDTLEATHLPGTEAVRAYIAYAVTTNWDYQATLDRARNGARGLVSYTERLSERFGLAPTPVTDQRSPETPEVTGAAEVLTAAVAPQVTGAAPVPASPQGLVPERVPPPATAEREPRGEDERLAWPAKGPVTGNFGYRRHPISRLLGPHEGIDLAVPTGAPVTAAAPGRVTAVFRGLTGGLTVELSHAGFTTRYLHLSAAKVKVGDQVEAGSLIALAGATGVATGPHLHFEVRMAGRPVDPLPLLPR